jgi:hypothetical protein
MDISQKITSAGNVTLLALSVTDLYLQNVPNAKMDIICKKPQNVYQTAPLIKSETTLLICANLVMENVSLALLKMIIVLAVLEPILKTLIAFLIVAVDFMKI